MAAVGLPRRQQTLASALTEAAARAAINHAPDAATYLAKAAEKAMADSLRRKGPSLRGTARNTSKRRVSYRSGKIQEFKRTRTQLREIKNVSATLPTFTSSTGDIQLVNGIAQGDTESTRDGRYILPQKLLFNLWLSYNAGTSDINFRVLCVVDTMPTGSTPAITDVLETAEAASHYNLDNASRFRICFDKLYFLPREDTSTLRTRVYHESCDVSKCGTVAYSDNGGTVSSIVKNACYLIYVGFGPSSAGNRVQYTFVDQ